MFPRTAVVTGAAGGLGQAIVARLESEGCEVRGLDLVDGFDVTDPAAWESVERAELACLNAGIAIDQPSIVDLSDEEYRRIVSVNVDGVVFGVRRLARVMEDGDAIVVTASLAGLAGVEGDPIYSLTKHAVIGLVRSVAPQLAERGIRTQRRLPGLRRHADGARRAAGVTRGRGLPAAAAGRRRGGRLASREERGHGRGLDRPAGP